MNTQRKKSILMHVHLQSRHLPIFSAVFGLILLLSGSSHAAMNAYAFLQAEGTDIMGEPTQITIGGEDVSDSIECMATVHEYFKEHGWKPFLDTTDDPQTI